MPSPWATIFYLVGWDGGQLAIGRGSWWFISTLWWFNMRIQHLHYNDLIWWFNSCASVLGGNGRWSEVFFFPNWERPIRSFLAFQKCSKIYLCKVDGVTNSPLEQNSKACAWFWSGLMIHNNSSSSEINILPPIPMTMMMMMQKWWINELTM